MARPPETPEDILLAHAAIHDTSTVRCPKCKQEPGYSPEFTATCEGLTAAAFLDRLNDEAFPDDPYMLGQLHAEMDRLGYGRIVRNGDPQSPTE